MTKEDIKKALEFCGVINSPCVNCPYKNVENCYNTLNNDALALIIKQESEIEQLRTTLGQCNTELNSALESLKSQCREIGELKAGTKQAKIDVLNELKDKMFEREYMGVKYKQGVFSESEIDNMIAEVQNAEDKG